MILHSFGGITLLIIYPEAKNHIIEIILINMCVGIIDWVIILNNIFKQFLSFVGISGVASIVVSRR